MMKMSTQVRYGLRAVVEMALRGAWKGAPGRPLPLSVIVKEQGIPEPFLRRIFFDLKRRGLVESVMGKDGGYRLARTPERITAFDVAAVFGEEILPVPCLKKTAGCKRIRQCPTNRLWCRVADLLRKALKETTVAYLAAQCPGRGHAARCR